MQQTIAVLKIKCKKHYLSINSFIFINNIYFDLFTKTCMPDFTLPFALPLRPEFSSLYERALVKAFCFRMCYKSMLFIRFSPNLLCTGHTCSFMYSNLTIFSKDLPESNLMSEKNYELWVGWVALQIRLTYFTETKCICKRYIKHTSNCDYNSTLFKHKF